MLDNTLISKYIRGASRFHRILAGKFSNPWPQIGYCAMALKLVQYNNKGEIIQTNFLHDFSEGHYLKRKFYFTLLRYEYLKLDTIDFGMEMSLAKSDVMKFVGLNPISTKNSIKRQIFRTTLQLGYLAAWLKWHPSQGRDLNMSWDENQDS